MSDAVPEVLQSTLSVLLNLSVDAETTAASTGNAIFRRIAYYCRFHGMRKVVASPTIDKGAADVSAYLLRLMEQLETEKTALGISKENEPQDRVRPPTPAAPLAAGRRAAAMRARATEESARKQGFPAHRLAPAFARAVARAPMRCARGFPASGVRSGWREGCWRRALRGGSESNPVPLLRGTRPPFSRVARPADDDHVHGAQDVRLGVQGPGRWHGDAGHGALLPQGRRAH